MRRALWQFQAERLILRSNVGEDVTLPDIAHGGPPTPDIRTLFSHRVRFSILALAMTMSQMVVIAWWLKRRRSKLLTGFDVIMENETRTRCAGRSR